MKAKASQYFAPHKTCDGQGPTVEILEHPFPFQSDLQQGRAQRSADMRPPLTPIQACVGEPAAQRWSGIEVHAKRRKRLRSIRGEIVSIGAARRTGRQPAKR